MDVCTRRWVDMSTRRGDGHGVQAERDALRNQEGGINVGYVERGWM